MTRRRTCEFVLIGAFVLSFLSLAAYAQDASKSLRHSLQHTRASAVVMALQPNAIEESVGNLVFATPGSLLKAAVARVCACDGLLILVGSQFAFDIDAIASLQPRSVLAKIVKDDDGMPLCSALAVSLRDLSSGKWSPG